MVREYLERVLQENGEQIAENTLKIEEQKLEKESLEQKIAKIQTKKDFDMEYFSPRRSEGSLREQLGELQQKKDALNEEIQKMEEEQQVLEEKQENFRKMLEEVVELEKQAKCFT